VPTEFGPVGRGAVRALVWATAVRGNRENWPRPAKITCCGLSVLLSVMVREALYPTGAAGLKLTVRLQEMPGATLRPQAFALKANSGGLAPVTVMPETLKAEVPVLVSVVVKDLVRPVFTVPKAKVAGAIFTVPFVNMIVAAADLVVSVTDVGVSVTVVGFGRAAGAV
jgi:hypothetical protein